MNEHLQSVLATSPFMTPEEVQKVLPQSGRALVTEYVSYFNASALIACKTFDADDEPHYFIEPHADLPQLESINVPLLNNEYLTELDGKVFEGHFNIMPAHDMLHQAFVMLTGLLGLPVFMTYVYAIFKGPVRPGDNLRIQLKNVVFDHRAKRVSCIGEIANANGGKICSIRGFEGKICRHDRIVAFDWLLEHAAQAATLFKFNSPEGLAQPIIMTAIEAEFFNPVASGSKVNAAVYNSSSKRGIDSCQVDLTNELGQVVAMVKNLNGTTLDRIAAD